MSEPGDALGMESVCLSTSPWISILSDGVRHTISVETLYNKEAEGPDWTDFAFPLWNGGRAGGWDPGKKIE